VLFWCDSRPLAWRPKRSFPRISLVRADKNASVKHDAGRAFLGELIDDAGLFPPARLSMEDALAAHERALASEAFWLVGRFVVPASRIGDLALALDDAPRPLGVTVVVDGATHLADGLQALGRAARGQSERVAIEALEVPFARLAGETDDERLAGLERLLAPADFPVPPDLYVEVSLGDSAEPQLVALERARGRGFAVAAKVRCGGLEASAVPAPAVLAHFLWTANRANVPFKGTAGLHHALPFDDPSIGARTHGFLNLIGGAVLARARGVDRHTLETLLSDRDPANFRLNGTHFSWSGIGADATEVAEARSDFVHSYGSCSLEEPLGDLRELALLPALTR
jgi:hypothetical protein